VPLKTASLRRTQRWLQGAITGTGEANHTETLRRIAPSAALAPDERTGIYRDLYAARMVAALKLDYPLLAELLGGPTFTELALLYTQARPSRSYSLNAFGRHLPEFLKEIRGLPNRAFAQDVARLEWARAEVFHEAESQVLMAEDVAAVAASAWPSAKLIPIAALRLIELGIPAHRLSADDGCTTALSRRKTYLAVYRRNYDVYELAMTRSGFEVLKALCDGKPLSRAIGRHQRHLALWFQEWTAAGLFARIETLRSGRKHC
jgi:hypothetical protein